MEIIAKGKFIRMSPRKVRLVAGLIRGLEVDKAKWQLTFNKKIASKALLKILDSAVANAKENYEVEEANLKVETVTVDSGPALKRWTPRAHGRATPIRKETSHVKIVLTEIVASGKTKKVKAVDTSDIIKVGAGAGEFDELAEKNVNEEKTAGAKTAKNAPAKGFASRILNRRTGAK
jgi:large subunit ribosomal protein L22